MTAKEIEQLLNKYFDGETSVEDEKRLRDFFLNDEVPEHLKKYSELFRYFEQAGHNEISVEALIEQIPDDTAVSSNKPGRVIYWVSRVAAVFIILTRWFCNRHYLSAKIS